MKKDKIKKNAEALVNIHIEYQFDVLYKVLHVFWTNGQDQVWMSDLNVAELPDFINNNDNEEFQKTFPHFEREVFILQSIARNDKNGKTVLLDSVS